MIHPYLPDPTHNRNPVQPVNIPDTDITLCGCEQCCNTRQDITNRLPPIIDTLPKEDAEDHDTDTQ